MATRKPYIKVVSVKDTKQGDCKLTLDMNQAGREVILQAGIQKALSDYMVANTKKLSFWNKLQICWSILK
jgi:hypothetical protein